VCQTKGKKRTSQERAEARGKDSRDEGPTNREKLKNRKGQKGMRCRGVRAKLSQEKDGGKGKGAKSGQDQTPQVVKEKTRKEAAVTATGERYWLIESRKKGVKSHEIRQRRKMRETVRSSGENDSQSKSASAFPKSIFAGPGRLSAGKTYNE